MKRQNYNYFKENRHNKKDIIFELKDYMFISHNIDNYTKNIFQAYDDNVLKPKESDKYIPQKNNKNNKNTINNYIKQDINLSQCINEKNTKLETSTKLETPKKIEYKPRQKDSLFWCFYILKNGFFNYEIEINRHFIIEKTEKFKYIELLRKNKDILKIHKIKPFTDLEDELANKNSISIKTFFALCIVENINVLLVNNRKIYELLSCDIDNEHPLNIVHKNKNEHWIEVESSTDDIEKYKNTYYKMDNFDANLKSISSYKLDDLLELCEKLNINIEEHKQKENKKKMTKKDIYELLVLNY